MSHVTGTVQTVAPVITLGPDFGPATGPANTWALTFNPAPAPGGTRLLILHFTAASLPANNRLEVDLGYDTDVFTSADGTDFWTRPINVYALAAGVPIRYITNGAATGGVRLDQYGRGERHAGWQDPTALSNCDPFQGDAVYTEPKYDPLWFCNTPPNWENAACTTPAADIRNAIEPAVGMVMHVDYHQGVGFHLSTCSVTLVGPDTVLTAGHCMASPIDDARSASVIFNYRTQCNGHRPNAYAGRFFKVKEVIRQRYADGSANDYCLLRLVVPPGGLGITPVSIRSDLPAAGEQVFGIHHPNGAVKKLSVPHPGFATVIASGVNAIKVSLDVSGGSSGSGLFDAAGRITGVLSNGFKCNLAYFPTATMQQDIASPPAITRDVMLVFDRSGSMSLPGTSGVSKMAEAQAAASLFVSLVRAGTGNRVGLVSFSTTASNPIDFALAAVTAATQATLTGPTKIGGLTPGGSTSIGDGLNAAYGQLTDPARLKNVLLFTDGLQNTPPLVDPANTFPPSIFIDAIGYGTPASIDGAMLATLAMQHRGHYVLADTNLKLQKFFSFAFGNIFEAGLLLDPEFVLPQGQTAAAPLPFGVCEEETVTVVVGWDNRRARLAVELTTPLGATVTAATPGVDSASGLTWTFLRVPLPQGGERDGTWTANVFRPGAPGVEFSAGGPETAYFVNVVAGGGAVLRRMPNAARYYTGDVINPLVGLQYLRGGLPPNAEVTVTVSRPDASVGTLLAEERLGATVVVDADTIPARQATLMAIEQRTGRPVVGYTEQTFPLFDEVEYTGAPEAAGIFGNPLEDLLTVEGEYAFRFKAGYGEGCTATRELLWSVHVDPGVDPGRTDVTVNGSGGRGTVTLVPRDKYGNKVGPGRGDGLSLTGVPGTTVAGPVSDNADGSYTVPVSWDPSLGAPGVVIGQPGRPPVVVQGGAGADPCREWKIRFWVLLLVLLVVLVLLVWGLLNG